MRRLVAALIIAMTAFVPSSTMAQDAPPASLVEQLIAASDESLGEDSTVAVLRAFDRGYDLLPIIEAIFDGVLAVDGTVTDEEGAPIAPTTPAAGVIAENAAAGTSGPVGGAARVAGPTSAEEIALSALEAGIKKTSARLDKKNDLEARAEDYDTPLNVFTMLAVLILIDSGYSPQQIVLDGFMAGGIDIGLGGVVLLDEKGRVVPPGDNPPTFGDEQPAVDSLIDDIFDAVSGEDPLARADDSFKREFTLTIDVEITGDGSTGTIEGKANIGERKRAVDLISGRGTGTLKVEGACSLSEGDTTRYPYTVEAPLRIGIAGLDDHGKATLSFGIAAKSVNVDAEGDSICLDIVRDTADLYPQFIPIPDVTVRLHDGATASADGQDAAAEFTTGIAVRVKKI